MSASRRLARRAKNGADHENEDDRRSERDRQRARTVSRKRVDLGEAAPERQDGAVGAADARRRSPLRRAQCRAREWPPHEMGVAVGLIGGKLVGSPMQQDAIGVVQADKVEPSQIGGQSLLDPLMQFGVAFAARHDGLVGEAGATRAIAAAEICR